MSASRMPLLVQRSVAAYRFLLRLFPSQHQIEYSQEMRLTFEDLCRETFDTDGPKGVLVLWIWIVGDLAGNVVREHSMVWRYKMRIRNQFVTGLGLLLLGYSSAFTMVNILKYQLGFSTMTNPFDRIVDGAPSSILYGLLNGLIILGPAAAFVMFILPLLRIKIDLRSQQLATITVNRGSRLTMLLLALCLIVGGIFVIYVTFENLPCLLGQRTSC